MTRTGFTTTLGLVAAATFLGCGEAARPVAGPASAADSGASGDAGMSEGELGALAERQKVCAVTGEPLGSMGPPVPVRVTDSTGGIHTVLLCCESCRGKLLGDPDGHLAKLAAAKR